MPQVLKSRKCIFQWPWNYVKKARYLIFICSLALQGCFTVQSFASLEEFDNADVTKFLNILAMAEEGDWLHITDGLVKDFPEIANSSPGKMLSRLKINILESDDLELIKLYNRAVRNHDTLSSEKAEPVPCYYKHYQAPDFFVPEINLTIDVKESAVLVTSELFIKRNSQKNSLILDGKDHKVHSILVNGALISKQQYKITPHELILFNIPEEDHFKIAIQSEINPFKNDSLEGMYRCGDG